MIIENIFNSLDQDIKDLMTTANIYFSGDVTVFDSSNTEREKYLNEIESDLGEHELALLKKEHIFPLNEAGYGKNY